MRRWYLGIHRPNWLADPRLADVPVFITRRVFPKGRFPRKVGPYAIDSGGFTELQHYGQWTITPAAYVTFLRRAWAEVGPFDFAAPMDWMCEDIVIQGGRVGPLMFVGTGLTQDDHLRLTVANSVELDRLAPDLPIIRVVQGQRPRDYVRCAQMYADAGVDLTREPLVGVGSVCRRQHMEEAVEIMEALRDFGIPNLHGFGFKIEGLRQCWHLLDTADSMAWSLDGRYAGPCQHPPYRTGLQPKSEANCLSYALAWRDRHVGPPAHPHERQLALFGVVAA